jgi:ribonucleoside-diphosphate reductase alpha chain
MTLPLSDNARIVLAKRYLKKDLDGTVIEKPMDLFLRVAKTIAQADTIYDPNGDVEVTTAKFLDMLTTLRFIPNSPTLMNAGRKLGQLAACFVLPIEDSMDSIFETLKHTAMIHKSGGGTGFSFSRIRPKNDAVLSTAGVSSGPLSFMGVFDVATDTVKQGGTRRGANMGVLRVDHPDIEDFIDAKNDLSRLNNFNISVGLTKSFMEAFKAQSEYDIVNPRTGKIVRRVLAAKVFGQIVNSAWQTGEPGIIFIDRLNSDNPTPQLGDIEATNPCGEQPLLPYESCTLGSINLACMVKDGTLDRSLLNQTVADAIHFLDNVIDINKYPLKRIAEMSKGSRKIGLGVMGFADMLIKLKIPYDSDEAVAIADKVMAQITADAKKSSAKLALKRGNFPFYKDSQYDNDLTPAMRNATTTTIAPTGTISIIAGASSGIEPLFAVAHFRHVLDGQSLPEMHPLFIEIAKKEGFYSDQLAGEIISSGSLQHLAQVPQHVKAIFRTAHDIAPDWHIKIQAAFQKHTDNAVSKTINFPSSASPEDVAKAYLMADEQGLKGVTIYRDGSRDNQVLQIGTKQETAKKIAPRARPEKTHGFTERMKTGCGKLYVTINSDDKGMCEVFAQMGKTGGCASSQIEAAGRLISLALRSGVKIESIAKQLIGIRCPSPCWQNGAMTLSCPDAIAQVLTKQSKSGVIEDTAMQGVCPDCGGILTPEEGCLACHSCGFSKCR